jgi:hypothetical protein
MGWVVSVTPLSLFSPGEGILGTHCAGGWVGPRAGVDTDVTGKVLSPLPGIEPRSPGRPVRSQTLLWLSYPSHQIHTYCRKFLRKFIMINLLTDEVYSNSWSDVATDGLRCTEWKGSNLIGLHWSVFKILLAIKWAVTWIFYPSCLNLFDYLIKMKLCLANSISCSNYR